MEYKTVTTLDGSKKYRKIKRLFKEQDGLCWVCGLKMIPPRLNGKPSRITATLDHLQPKFHKHKTGDSRQTKAAHMGCNNSRHHYDLDHPKVIGQVKCMHRLFSNAKWRTRAFAEEGGMTQTMSLMAHAMMECP